MLVLVLLVLDNMKELRKLSLMVARKIQSDLGTWKLWEVELQKASKVHEWAEDKNPGLSILYQGQEDILRALLNQGAGMRERPSKGGNHATVGPSALSLTE